MTTMAEAVARYLRLERAVCDCHHESGDHDGCCGYDGGRSPNCPVHGDGTTP